MKKKILSFLAVISAFLFIGNVQAVEMDKDDIARGSYVIGTHLFERTTTAHYDGTLTVQHIMLAAQSIGSNDINDMVIYLKNSRGNWVNGLTNETVTMPEMIEIEYQNVVNIAVPSPTLDNIGGYGAEYIDFIDGEYWYDLTVDPYIEKYNWKLYEKSGNDYKLVKDITDGVITVRVEAGDKKTFVATYCETRDGKEVCSGYSNEVVIDTMKNLSKPELVKYCGKDTCHLGIHLDEYPADDFEIQFDVYEKKVNENIYVGTAYAMDGGQSGNVVSVDITEEPKTYVTQISFTNKSGKKVYGQYSDAIEISIDKLKKETYIGLGVDAPSQHPYETLYTGGMYNYYTRLYIDGWHNYDAWTLYQVELGNNGEIISKTPVSTEYIQSPIKVQVEAGKSAHLIAGLCTNRADNDYSNCEDYFTDITTNINTRDFLKIPELISNTGTYSPEWQKIEYVFDFNSEDYNVPSLNPDSFNEMITGAEYYEVLADGTKECVDIVPAGEGMSFVRIDHGQVKKYVARVYIEDTQGNKFYSDYSNEVVLDATTFPLLISGGELDGLPLFDIRYVNRNNGNGIELFYEDNAGEWQLVTEEIIWQLEPDGDDAFAAFQINSTDPKYFDYNYKVRIYTIDSETGEKVYSDFSPVASFE